MKRIALVIALPVLVAFSATLTAGKLYRWVDEFGNVHYTDTIPPSQVDRAHQELRGDGVQVRTVPRAKTREELEQEREIERLRAEQQRLIEEQQAADRVLLRTFRSEDDIILARDGKVTAIDLMIKVTQSNIRRYQARLADQQRRAASLELKGKAIPTQILEGIDSTNRAIEESYATIVQREGEKDAIREVFARDLARFRELKNLTPEAAAADTKSVKELSNLIRCTDSAACDEAWTRAEAFVRRHATTPIQMHGENIVMSAAAVQDKDVSITLSRIRDHDSGATQLFLDLSCKGTLLGEEHCRSPEVEAIRQAFRRDLGGE